MYWLIVIATCALLARSIWTRRWTLTKVSNRVALRERSMTMALVLQLAALFLMSPLSEDTAGRWLYAVTGHWNIDVYVGHCCYIGAAGAFALHVGTRLNINDEEAAAYFRQRVELPMTVIMPVLLALFLQSRNATHYWPDFFDCPTGIWLDLYWTLLCGYIAFLLCRALRSLRYLRRAPQNRRTANIYIAACSGGIACCALRICSTWHDDLWSHWFWYLCCACAVGFGYAAAQSWRERVRWFASTKL